MAQQVRSGMHDRGNHPLKGSENLWRGSNCPFSSSPPPPPLLSLRKHATIPLRLRTVSATTPCLALSSHPHLSSLRRTARSSPSPSPASTFFPRRVLALPARHRRLALAVLPASPLPLVFFSSDDARVAPSSFCFAMPGFSFFFFLPLVSLQPPSRPPPPPDAALGRATPRPAQHQERQRGKREGGAGSEKGAAPCEAAGEHAQSRGDSIPESRPHRTPFWNRLVPACNSKTASCPLGCLSADAVRSSSPRPAVPRPALAPSPRARSELRTRANTRYRFGSSSSRHWTRDWRSERQKLTHLASDRPDSRRGAQRGAAPAARGGGLAC